MADRVSASITLGGEIDAADYVELAKIIATERLSVDWDGEPFEPDHRTDGEPLSLYAHEVVGGQFETLESWCVEKGVPFVRWCGGYIGAWGPQRVVFIGQGDPKEYAADDDDQIVIARETVRELGSFEAILAHFDAADFKVPPLAIVEDALAPSTQA